MSRTGTVHLLRARSLHSTVQNLAYFVLQYEIDIVYANNSVRFSSKCSDESYAIHITYEDIIIVSYIRYNLYFYFTSSFVGEEHFIFLFKLTILPTLNPKKSENKVKEVTEYKWIDEKKESKIVQKVKVKVKGIIVLQKILIMFMFWIDESFRLL